MRILIFLFIVFIFGCGDTPDSMEEPNGLFSDTIHVTTTSEGVAARSISATTTQRIEIIDKNLDTNIITITPVTKTFTYTYPETDTVVKRYSGGVINPPPVEPPPTAGYAISYSNDYDQASDINTNQLGRGKQTTFDGRGVFMSEVRDGDASISSGYRSEQQYDNPQGSPIEGYWEWEAYYENWDQIRNKNGHSFQFHPKSSSGSAVWSLQNYNGKFDVVRSLNGSNFRQPGTLKTVEQNRWYKFKLEAKWSAGSDGYLNFYIDGVLYHQYKGATCSSSGVYVKIGQNTWSPIPARAVVYYDNFTVYKKL